MGLDLDNKPDILFVIEWASLSLFSIEAGSATRAQPWGRPDPGKPIFSGLDAENIRINERLESSERRPSGFKFPLPRHLSKEHIISVDRLWVTKPKEGDPTDPDDYVLKPNTLMCMYLLWREPVNGKTDAETAWKSRTYYGVTGPEYNISGSAESVSFTGDQSFRAMFYKGKTGKGNPPLIA